MLEFDPVRGEVVWEYVGAPPRSFFSLYCGTSARLEGGNTLITESGAGRAFELDPEGQLVWDFRSPHRAGERAELVAALFEVQRLDPASVSWLGR